MNKHPIFLKIFLLFSLLVYCLNVKAQSCSFNLDAIVAQHATCPSNGLIKVTLSGSEINLSHIVINVSGGLINESTSTNGFEFSSLPPGQYTVKATTLCKTTNKEVTQTKIVTINLEYDELRAHAEKINTLDCKFSGKASIVVSKGSPPYAITVVSAPNEYSGGLSFTMNSSGTYVMENLPEGNYVFSVSDACLYTLPVSVSVDKITADFPSNIYNLYASPTNCKQAITYTNDLPSNNELYYYWNLHRKDYYEVAFSVDGTKNWISPESYSQLIDLPESHRKLYNEGKKIKVYIRLKGTTCEKEIEEIELREPSKFYFYNNGGCGIYDLSFYANNPLSAICFPYTWEIKDNLTNPVSTGSASDYSTQTISNMEDGVEYTIKITDSEGNIITDTYKKNLVPPYFSGLWRDGNCDNYVLNFSMDRVCLPYDWELYDDNNAIVTSKIGVDSNRVQLISGLDYEKTYTIKVIDKTGQEVTQQYFAESPRKDFTYWTDNKCNTYDLTISPSSFCLPYGWEVLDKDSVVIDDKTNIDSIYEHKVYGLKYDSAYTIKVYDSKGDEKLLNIRTPRPIPYIYNQWYNNFQCFDYNMLFSMRNTVCETYKWEAIDNKGNVISKKENIQYDRYRYDTITGLPYNKDFNIKITDEAGYEFLYGPYQYYNSGYTSAYSYYTDSPSCMAGADSIKGYISITGTLDSATNIKFIDGPQIPPHADTTIQKTISDFYPFSANYEYYEYVSIKQGTYRFEVTDKCGKKDTLTIDFKKEHTVQDFGYTTEETCEGVTRVFPTGRVYENGTATSTYFTLIESPSGWGSTIRWDNIPSQYFTLSANGRYVIQISKYSSECAYDTIVIDYVKQPFSLEGRSSYVCDAGGKGQIRAIAKNGEAPYTYQLLKEGSPVSGVPENATGVFEFGALGEKYSVRIKDNCGKSFIIDVQITSLDQIPLISGSTEICEGEDISLNCALIGATSYEWDGPNWTSTNQSMILNSATIADSGEYIIKVQPAGCAVAIQDTVLVNVHSVPKPLISDTIKLCQHQQAQELYTEPAANCSIIWYDYNNSLLPTAPTPNTDNAGTTEFYVENLNIHGCQNKKQVVVSVNSLPLKNANATGRSCENGNPEITINDVVAGYTYYIFANNTATDTIAVITGVSDPMNITLPINVKGDTTLYIKTTNEADCYISPEFSQLNITVDNIEILPEKLPVYQHDTPYRVELTTNGIPVFSYSGESIPGITMATDGLISGIVPESAGVLSATFKVSLNNINGCTKEKEYTLRFCEPAPNIPNNTVNYCIGATADSLIAYSPTNLPLQWYAADGVTKLGKSPIPNTNTVGEQIFYVAQVNTDLNCEGTKAKITVKINPLPQINFDALADKVCFGNSAFITFDNLKPSYSYYVYSDAAYNNKITTITGITSGNVDLKEYPTESTKLYIQVSDSLNCLSKEMKEINIDVVKLTISPETLPVYGHDVAYSVMLNSNAVQPVYSHTGSLVTGITMNASGLIAGTVPLSAGQESKTFTVTVEDENGCTKEQEYILRTCEPAPIVVPNISYCQGAKAVPLEATSTAGLSLQWYASDMVTKLNAAPIPNTSVTGDHIYYVAQVNNTLNCEGIPAQITVSVTPYPDNNFNASINNVCFGNNPVVMLDNLNTLYSYNIFANNTLSEKLISLSGINSNEVLLDVVMEDDAVFYINVTDGLNCTSIVKEVNAKVVKLNIEPEKLEPYIRDKEYLQQLSSNADFPVFKLVEGLFPLGIAIGTSGNITGIATEKTNDKNIFTIEVKDSNGCTGTRQYTLYGDIFVPKVFTPNGDGINDIFMKGHKVVIMDRLGIVMYEGEDGWDGTYKGSTISVDIYFYKLYYTDISGEPKTKTGYIGVQL